MNIFGKEKEVKTSEVDEQKKRKELVDREIELYRIEKQFEADREIFEKKKDAFTALHILRKRCIDDSAELEHEYHSGVEEKRTLLAKLDAEIGFKSGLLAEVKTFETVRAERDLFKAEAEASKKICESKDKTIELLDGIVKVVVGKLSKVDVGSLAVHVAPTKEENKG